MPHVLRRNAVLTIFLILFGCAAAAAASEADNDIRIWEFKAKQDPEDGLSRSNLGVAYLQKARESGDFGYYRQAEDVLARSLAITPDYRPAMVSLAVAYNAQHRFKDAVPVMRKVLTMVDEPAANGVLGDALLETGAVDEAEKLYDKVLEKAPLTFGYTRKANVQILRGDTDGAIASLKVAIETGISTGVPVENVAWCQVQLGELYFSAGDFVHAREFYETALKTMPQYHQALDHLAELEGASGNYDAAVSIYTQLIERTPRPDLQQALGDLYSFRGMKTEARLWHASALAGYLKAVEQGNTHFYHHLAGYYCDVDEDPAPALKWAQEDMKLRQNIYAWDTLAWAQYKNGRYAEAAESCAKALALGTKNAHLYFHAGMIYARAGDFAKSRECAQTALKINPAFEKFHVHR